MALKRKNVVSTSQEPLFLLLVNTMKHLKAHLVRDDGKLFPLKSEVFISIQNLTQVSHINVYTVYLHLYILLLAIFFSSV